jgi:hypothetical protein
MRLREKDVEKCEHCGWNIYKLRTTGLWYDMVHHDFVCPNDKLHAPKEDRRKRDYAGTDYA